TPRKAAHEDRERKARNEIERDPSRDRQRDQEVSRFSAWRAKCFGAHAASLQQRVGSLRDLSRAGDPLERYRPYLDSRLLVAPAQLRIEQGLRGQSARGPALDVQLALARRNRAAKSRQAGRHAETAQETSPRADPGRDERTARQRLPRERGFFRTRSRDLRAALWLRPAQLGAGRDRAWRCRRCQRRDSGPRKRKETALCAFGRRGC